MVWFPLTKRPGGWASGPSGYHRALKTVVNIPLFIAGWLIYG